MSTHGIDGNGRSVIYRCDNFLCGEYLVLTADDELPEPWRVVRVMGVVGNYHACCDTCERRVRSQ